MPRLAALGGEGGEPRPPPPRPARRIPGRAPGAARPPRREAGRREGGRMGAGGGSLLFSAHLEPKNKSLQKRQAGRERGLGGGRLLCPRRFTDGAPPPPPQLSPGPVGERFCSLVGPFCAGRSPPPPAPFPEGFRGAAHEGLKTMPGTMPPPGLPPPSPIPWRQGTSRSL